MQRVLNRTSSGVVVQMIFMPVYVVFNTFKNVLQRLISSEGRTISTDISNYYTLMYRSLVLSFKAALINIFTLSMDKVTIYNVKMVIHSNTLIVIVKLHLHLND